MFYDSNAVLVNYLWRVYCNTWNENIKWALKCFLMSGSIITQSCGSFLFLLRPKTNQRTINDANSNVNSWLWNFKVAQMADCPQGGRKTIERAMWDWWQSTVSTHLMNVQSAVTCFLSATVWCWVGAQCRAATAFWVSYNSSRESGDCSLSAQRRERHLSHDLQ